MLPQQSPSLLSEVIHGAKCDKAEDKTLKITVDVPSVVKVTVISLKLVTVVSPGLPVTGMVVVLLVTGLLIIILRRNVGA